MVGAQSSAQNCTDPFFLAQNPNNTTVVPEPSTWALMILGFGMVGFASRRRSKTVSHLS
jgi:hypothetical protein